MLLLLACYIFFLVVSCILELFWGMAVVLLDEYRVAGELIDFSNEVKPV